MPPMTTALPSLAPLILQHQLMTEDALSKAATDAKNLQRSFVQHLVASGLIDAAKLLYIQSLSYNLPIYKLPDQLSQVVETGCDPALFLKYRILPLNCDKHTLTLAMSDVTDKDAIAAMRFHARRQIRPVLVEEDRLSALLDKLYLDTDTFEDTQKTRSNSQATTDDAPTVSFVNKLFTDAIRLKVSDIHFEPYDTSYRIRFRIDGVMQVMHNPPKSMAAQIASYIKVMANLDIAERRRAQDGRLKFTTQDGRSVDFRVSTLPTLHGEKVVLRLLDSTQALIGLDELGMDDAQKQLFIHALSRPQGMILVTGPTGSGKTVSLYTALMRLNQSEINILSCEDPVEINLAGINQVNINPKVQLDFADALRAFLRQDPDVIMVGEIRDTDTAQIATTAAQTGHLVLSTLHTNSASDTITRMHSMGVPSFHLASSLSLIIAQRLARRLCDACKKPITIPYEALRLAGFSDQDIAKQPTLYAPVGCHKCNNGHKGRIGIFEVLPITPPMAELILTQASAAKIDALARTQGHDNLRQAGIKKVLTGQISLTEMHRVTSDSWLNHQSAVHHTVDKSHF